MKNVLIIKSEITRRDGRLCIREIRASGFMDDSGKFRITGCFGKMYSDKSPGTAAPALKSEQTAA